MKCEDGCRYSRAVDQPYPRKCINCGVVEEVHSNNTVCAEFEFGMSKAIEYLKYARERADRIKKRHTVVEQEQVYLSRFDDAIANLEALKVKPL